MTIIILNALKITGKLNSDTPFLVLKRISEMHNLDNTDYEYINQKLSENSFKTVQRPYDSDDYQDMAEFINSRHQWDKDSLVRTIEYIFNNYSGSRYTQPDLNFEYGLPNSSSHKILDICILYRMCEHYGIKLNYENNLEDMANLLTLYLGDNNIAQTLFFKIIPKLKKSELINLYSKAISQIDEYQVSSEENYKYQKKDIYESISQSIKTFEKEINYIERINPLTHGEAIYLAAVLYKYDISLSENPINEYFKLRSNPTTYIPDDEKMRKAQKINPFILNLNLHFNPKLPIELYDDDDLGNMCLEEGYTLENIDQDNPYTLLQTVHIVKNFHHGSQPYMTKNVTPVYLEEIENVNYNEIVCYGVKNSPSILMQPFLYSELNDVFETYMKFMNPIDKKLELFDSQNINKLKILCNKIYPNDTKKAKSDRMKLYKTILKVEIYTDEKNIKIKEFSELFEKTNPTIKNKIVEVLNKLLNLSMYTRGWMGEGNFPIKEAPVENQNIVDIKVTDALISFEKEIKELSELSRKRSHDNLLEEENVTEEEEETDDSYDSTGSCMSNLDMIMEHYYASDDDTNEYKGVNVYTVKENINDISSVILNLPLLIYRNDFIHSNDSKYGITLQDRINMLKTGTDHDDYSSCIRLTSNWLAASCYRYMVSINLDPPFDIRNLTEIS